MTSAATKAVPSALGIEEANTSAGVSEFVGIALFSGIGLQLSLAVVLLDQLTPFDWF